MRHDKSAHLAFGHPLSWGEGERAVTALALVILLPAILLADEGAAFLKIGVGARAVGLGAAQTALADDSSAVYWNPAGLASMTATQVAAHHAEMLADTQYDFITLGRPTKLGTVGVGLGYLSQGSIEGRDENRTPTGSFTASDAVAQVALGRELNSNVRLGLGIKAIQSRIADESATTGALDLGVVLKPTNSRTTVGLSILNIGPGLRFIGERDELPLTIAAGVAWPMPFGFTLAADARVRPNSDSTEFGVGSEYAALSALTLRAGWLGSRVEGSRGARERAYLPDGFAAGLGVKVSNFRMDYTFVPFGELGNTQRISLTAGF